MTCLFVSRLLLFCTYAKQIRSGHLSGDCHFKRELLRGYLKVRGHGQVSFFFLEIHMD